MMFLHAEDAGAYVLAMLFVAAAGAWTLRLATRRGPR